MLDRVVEEECFGSRAALVAYLACAYERQREVRPRRKRRARELPLTVPLALPRDARALVRRRAALDEYGLGENEVVRGALWHMRSSQMSAAEHRDEFKREILQALNSGPGTPATPKFWRDLERDAREHVKLKRAAERRGELANLSLPRELFEFVNAELLSGRHETPTAVVCAALRLCEHEGWRHEEAWKEMAREQEKRLAEAEAQVADAPRASQRRARGRRRERR